MTHRRHHPWAIALTVIAVAVLTTLNASPEMIGAQTLPPMPPPEVTTPEPAPEVTPERPMFRRLWLPQIDKDFAAEGPKENVLFYVFGAGAGLFSVLAVTNRESGKAGGFFALCLLCGAGSLAAAFLG